MPAIGSLLLIIVYIFLIAVAVLTLYLAFSHPTKKPRGIWLAISITFTLLTLRLAYVQNRLYADESDRYVGTYKLHNYHKCLNCKLILRDDNTYSVIGSNGELEKGHWEYKRGGDFWFVEIGENGQLGSGEFMYDEKID